MDYTSKYHQLNSLLVSDAVTTDFPGSDISCYWVKFRSENISMLAEERDQHFHGINEIIKVPDEDIPENKSFSYPVFKSAGSAKNQRAIILLHGLNERNWNKYLVWAYYLVSKTGRPVILFPIAFHMNRSPELWSNPRLMSSFLAFRNQRTGKVPMSTFANVALSERLYEDPLRFFTSGQQSVADLVQLAKQLYNGEHPLFEKDTVLDVFAYSIGAFLAQILFMANPGGWYSASKLFLFCGGAFFDDMNGVSKLIMDQQAFNRLRQFYIQELTAETERSPILFDSINKTEMGMAFSAMLSEGNLKPFRENAFQKMNKQMRVVALLKDKVIPAEGIRKALNRFIDVDVLDFPYSYSHENPFPLIDGEESKLVNESFEKVFSKAAAFLK